MNIHYHLLGWFNPGFSEQVNTFMINPFVKYVTRPSMRLI
jgi:hypothetical protein